MRTKNTFEECEAFIRSQLHVVPHKQQGVRPAVTLSRMAGAGGHRVAGALAADLQTRTGIDWTVFDRNLVEKVLEDHQLSRDIARYMPEDHTPLLNDCVEQLAGLHPSTWTLVRHTSETLLHLARMGGVVLVGRGGCVVAGLLPNTFHIRLVGSPEERTARLEEENQLDAKAAAKLMHKLDHGRRRYFKDHFNADIDDPLLYDLVINTDRISCDAAVRMVGDEIIRRFALNPRPASSGR